MISIYKLQNVSPYCLIKQINKILGIRNSEIWLFDDVSKIIFLQFSCFSRLNISKQQEQILAIIKKQGTSGLPEVHDNIDGTQSCMCCKATHAAEKVSSWLQSTADCGSGRMSQFFRFFLYFLDLGFSQEFIASDQKQGNKILMTSSATMGLNFWSKIGSPIPMTSNSLCFYCF